MKAYNYCKKKDTHIEGPWTMGVPPACRNITGDTKKRNEMILEYGAVKALDEGLIPIQQYHQVKRSINEYLCDKS